MAGAITDTIPGKYGTKEIIRENANLFYQSRDYLADKKDHTMSPLLFKMLGLTVDFQEIQESWIVNPKTRKGYYPSDIISGTYSLKISGRGKWLKKMFKTEDPVEMYVLYEIYPIEVEHLTGEEAKEIKDNPPTTKFDRGPNVTPLTPSIQRIVDYFDTKK